MKGKSKAAQTRHEWREAHPKADEAMAAVKKILWVASRNYLDRRVRNHLPANFYGRRKGFAKWAKGAVKFYEKKEHLTQQRTEQLFMADGDGDTSKCIPGPMWLTAIWLTEEWDRAYKASGLGEVKAYWDKFLEDHPNMTPTDQERVRTFQRYGNRREDLYSHNRLFLKGVEDAHKPTSSSKKSTVTAADAESASKCPWN